MCMRCRDIMLEKYELTTPGYTDSDDENEMRLRQGSCIRGGDRRVIHRRGLKIARSQRWIVCYFENRAIAPFGRPFCCKGIVNGSRVEVDLKCLFVRGDSTLPQHHDLIYYSC